MQSASNETLVVVANQKYTSLIDKNCDSYIMSSQGEVLGTVCSVIK